jgi:hypothetical protein
MLHRTVSDGTTVICQDFFQIRTTFSFLVNTKVGRCKQTPVVADLIIATGRQNMQSKQYDKRNTTQKRVSVLMAESNTKPVN